LKNIIIITSFDKKKGLGHCARQLSLSKYLLAKNIKIFFLTEKNIPKFMKINNKKIKFKVLKNKKKVLSYINEIKPKWIFIDVHQSEIDKYKYLSKLFKIAIFVSDVKKKYKKYGKIFFEYGKNILIKNYIFKKKDRTFFSGRNYVWFRKEFLNLKKKKIKKRDIDIFISHGGTDTKNISLKNISMLENFYKKLSIYLVVTSRFKHLDSIYRLCKKSKHDYYIYKDIKNISRVMENSKLAIINGGNTRYELCMTGTPFLTLSVNRQQTFYNKPFSKLKIGSNLGIYNRINQKIFLKKIKSLLGDKDFLQKISNKMRNIFDYYAPKRIKKILEL